MTHTDFAALAPLLEPRRLGKGEEIVGSQATIDYVHFPESGLASIVATSPEGLEVEAGMFGFDGFGPVPAIMGSAHSPHAILMQIPGETFRIPRQALMQVVAASPDLRDLLLRFAQVMAVQTAFTALSNAVHAVDERLARWLLMCHDRVDADEIALTHDFLSLMLAVRRPSVTTALHVLEGNGFINGERGYITIRNRLRLEEFAGDAYGRPEAEYRRLIGPMR